MLVNSVVNFDGSSRADVLFVSLADNWVLNGPLSTHWSSCFIHSGPAGDLELVIKVIGTVIHKHKMPVQTLSTKW